MKISSLPSLMLMKFPKLLQIDGKPTRILENLRFNQDLLCKFTFSLEGRKQGFPSVLISQSLALSRAHQPSSSRSSAAEGASPKSLWKTMGLTETEGRHPEIHKFIIFLMKKSHLEGVQRHFQTEPYSKYIETRLRYLLQRELRKQEN